MVVMDATKFRFDFDITSGEERIASIAGGAALDGYDYIMETDPTGEAREFWFDFATVGKTIGPDSTVNMVIKTMDHDGVIRESKFSKYLGIENGEALVSGIRLSQRVDGSRLVDVYYDLASPDEIDPSLVTFLVSNDDGSTFDVLTTTAVGDLGADVPSGQRRHVVWDPQTDYPGNDGKAVVARISAYSYRTQTTATATSGRLILASAQETPILSLVLDPEKARYGIEDGEQFKNR
jgi:hypothetical protein